MTFQFGSTMMDFFVLSIVRQEDTYGYAISQTIKKVADQKESTLYPVLRRLQEHQYLETFDQIISGRNRKYYKITPQGEEQYNTYVTQWEQCKEQIDQIIKGGAIQ
jgi:PadR family transcriptional regulator PadR